MVQGDITSPLFFVLALQLILKRHDKVSGKDVPFSGDIVHTLAYADDAALLDRDVETATARVMTINVGKTEVVQFCEQGKVPASTAAETRAICNHK